MLIEKIAEWQLTPQDHTEIAALLARCFDNDFGGRSFFTQPHHLRLIYRQGPVVAHMALLLRSVQLGQRRLTIAGLAEVATAPTHRGQGIATHLLQQAIAEAKTSPAEYLLLFGTAKLYAAAGFRNITNPIAHVSDTAVMMLPLRDQTWPDTAPLDLKGPVF